jgi:hypothetical protein
VILSCAGAGRALIGGRTFTIEAKDARASIEKDKERSWIAKLVTGPADISDGSGRWSLDAATINIAPSSSDLRQFDLSARLFGVESASVAETTWSIARLDAAVSLSPKETDGARALIAHGIAAAFTGALVRLAGTLVLAANGAPTGRLDAQIEKPVGLVRAIEGAGLLAGEEARAAEAGLAMLAVASGGTLSAPLDFEDGEVRLAGVRIAKRPGEAQP